MKKSSLYFIFLLFAIVVAATVVVLNPSKKTIKTQQLLKPTVPVSPTPYSSKEIDEVQIIKDLVAASVNCGDDGISECKVEKVSGDYAKGLMYQGWWISKRIDGVWKVVTTGNGIPQCLEIDKYGVPKEVSGNCIETAGNLRYSL